MKTLTKHQLIYTLVTIGTYFVLKSVYLPDFLKEVSQPALGGTIILILTLMAIQFIFLEAGEIDSTTPSFLTSFMVLSFYYIYNEVHTLKGIPSIFFLILGYSVALYITYTLFIKADYSKESPYSSIIRILLQGGVIALAIQFI